MIIGAGLTAALTGAFAKPAWQNAKQLQATTLGGVLMCISARLSFGFNIGPCLAGSTSCKIGAYPADAAYAAATGNGRITRLCLSNVYTSSTTPSVASSPFSGTGSQYRRRFNLQVAAAILFAVCLRPRRRASSRMPMCSGNSRT